MTKVISKNNNRCTVNDFIFARYFIYLFFIYFFFFFVKNHLLVIYDVMICTGYTVFANTLNLCVYIFRNNSKNKCLLKVKVFAVCLLG